MMKHKKMCEEILTLIGGRDNIVNCYNCMTRLRLILDDMTKADVNALKEVEGVIGVNVVGSQLQCIIGPEAGTVCKEFCTIAEIAQGSVVEDQASAREDTQLTEKKRMTLKEIPNKVIDVVSNCIQPLLPVIICGSMFKLLCSLLGPGMFNLITEDSNLYVLFYMLGDVPFYFLPFMIGYTGSKYFGISIPLGILMAGVLLHPTLIDLVNAQEAFAVYGIPMKLVNYSSSIVPMILCLWIMSYVDRFFQKVIPDIFQMMLQHLCTLLVMLPLGLCILAPAGDVIGNAIANVLIAVPQYTGPFGVALVCFVWPLLVAVGMHMPIAMLALSTYFAEGHENIIFIADSLQHFSVMGVALAFAIMAKNKENRSLGVSSFTAIFLGGVIEPTLFGIALPNKKYLFALLAGSGLAGLVAGIFNVGVYTLGASNIMNILCFSGGPSENFIFGLLACVVSFISGFVIALLLQLASKKKMEKIQQQ